MEFRANVSKASPKLQLACCSLEPFDTAVLTCRKAGGKEQMDYLIYTLKDVVVSSYELRGVPDGPELPQEVFALTFKIFEVEYKVQEKGQPKGSVKVGFDLTTMKPV